MQTYCSETGWSCRRTAVRLLHQTRCTFCHTRSLSNATFSFLITWPRHPVQNLLLCTKFYQNPMIVHWDTAIYRFSKWRPSAIWELLYYHTKPPTKSVAGRQISCQSDTHIWRYSYFNFSHIWLKMPIQAPKWRFGGLWTPKCDYWSSRPQKDTSLRKFASFKLSTVNIRWSELTESVSDTHTLTEVNLYYVHAQHSIGQTKSRSFR